MLRRGLSIDLIQRNRLVMVASAFAPVMLSGYFHQRLCLADMCGRLTLMVVSRASDQQIDPLQGD